MIAVDEAALRCDFLETYSILDYRALPARQAALFACGLRPNSRIMMKLAGSSASQDTLLLAGILDMLRILAWQNTKDGMDGRNFPVSVLDTLLQDSDPRDGVGFDSPEEYEAWRASMMGE